MLLKRAIPVARTLTTFKKTALPAVTCVRFAGYKQQDYVYPTMDDVPVPCGDWFEDYTNKQRKYNLHLLFGTGLFIITCTVAYFSGLMWCNSSDPERPAPKKPVC